MADRTLEDLVAAARLHRLTPESLREQWISFVLGNESAEGRDVYRGTVTVVVPPLTDRTTAIGNSTPALHQGNEEQTLTSSVSQVMSDIMGTSRQFRLIERLVESYSGQRKRLKIDAQLIKDMHAAALPSDIAAISEFRSVPVAVRGSVHEPPAPNAVSAEVDAMCKHLNSEWEHKDALYLASYALWRLNWIHPFVDGNGRVARALSYLILNLKVGMLLPGTPSILEQISTRRMEYFDALADADRGHLESGPPDLESIERLLEDMLKRQLLNLPLLSRSDLLQLSNIIEKRIRRTPQSTIHSLYGSDEVNYRAWAYADHLILHVGPPESIDQAERLLDQFGQPFPKLLAISGGPALVSVDARKRGIVLPHRRYEVQSGAAVGLERNAAVTIEKPHVVCATGQQLIDWEVAGALYVLRYGDQIGSIWALEVLDLLLTRHMQGA